MTYVIPAAQVLAVVHITDPAVDPKLIPADDKWTRERKAEAGVARVPEWSAASHTGRTVCGLDMLVEETWITWLHPGPDSLCVDCAAGRAGSDEQEALL